MKRPTLHQLADLSQIIAGIGVVLSLLYLATEVRNNTTALKAGTFQQVLSNSLTLRSFGIDDTTFVMFQLKASDTPDSLNRIEQRRWNHFMSVVFRSFENLQYQHSSGLLDADLWSGYDRMIRGLVAQPGYSRWFAAHSDQFSKRFNEYVADVLASPRPFGPMFAPVPR
jgi:hypothetical protein